MKQYITPDAEITKFSISTTILTGSDYEPEDIQIAENVKLEDFEH